MARESRPSYWLTRFLILRLLGLVYFVAFLSLAQQVLPLIGADGLLPVGLFLERVQTHFGSRFAGFLQIPSLFWLDASDRVLVTAAWAGTALSLVVLLGFANALLLVVLWAPAWPATRPARYSSPSRCSSSWAAPSRSSTG